ncbi:MAG: hypothetical protein ACE5H9_11140 [Anaerolineae bacterium]
MNTKPPPNRTPLRDWEQWLALQVRAVELLGEIPVTAGECQKLGQAIGLRLRSLGPTETARVIQNNYPCAFAVYLVAQGIFGYQGGDYWSQVCQVTGLKPNYTSRWGRMLEEILDRLRLPLFPDLGGRRYVDLILMHGGVPNYCLDDFFNNMLRPAVTREAYADMSAVELIDDWLHRASGRYVTDKPVLRFLEFGGQVAEDFVERCRELAAEFLETGLVPSAEEAGLPGRVVEAFHAWAVEGGGLDPTSAQRERSGFRLRRPVIRLDPWGEGLTLELPPQQIPATLSQAEVVWQVNDGGAAVELPVRIRRSGYDLRTTPETYLLETPAEVYQVSLLVGGQEQRSWRYHGPDHERPLLAFDPGSETLRRRGTALPAGPLWLLYPREAELDLVGEGQLLEEFPRLPGRWAAFRVQAWDLSQVSRLALLQDGETLFSIAIRPDEATTRPYLVGGEQFTVAGEAGSNLTPLYIGPPPAVRIPLAGRTGLIEELGRWRLTLRNRWAAHPTLDRSLPLSELRPYLQEGDGYVDLPLSLDPLLGDAPYGNFVLRLRGPLGRDAELRLRVLPRLTISGHEELYVPDPKAGPPPVTLLIETGPGDLVECQPEEGACRVQATTGQNPAVGPSGSQIHQVVADPETTTVALTVIKPAPDGEQVRVPVRVPLRRLRWKLVGEAGEGQGQPWTGWMLKRPLDALLQTQSPALLIDLGEVGQGLQADNPSGSKPDIQLSLSLVEADGAEIQRQGISASRRSQRRAGGRFNLAAFLDTLRYSRAPVLRFEVECRGLPEHDTPLRLPILSVTRSWSPRKVKGRIKQRQDKLQISLTWQDPVRLRHRRIRLWPLWQPWLPPFEQTIPDEAEGRFGFEAPVDQMPPGKYLLEFLVVDPWGAEPAPDKPPLGSPGAIAVEMIKPEVRLAQIDQAVHGKTVDRLKRGVGLKGGAPAFALLLERALICQQAGRSGESERAWQKCLKRFAEATVPQILILYDLVQQTGNEASLTGLQLKMFAAFRLQRLLDEYAAGQVTEAHFQAYLSHVPRSGLLPLDSCEKLLAVKDERVQLLAIQQLIRRDSPSGVEAVLARLKEAALSDADAVELLALNPDFTVEQLEMQADQPVVSRLLLALSKVLGDRVPVVRVGSWLRSPAGWGRIEQIEGLDDGQAVEQFIRGQTGLRLHVSLRPQHDAEPVTVEVLADRTYLNFKGAEDVLRCTEPACNFMTRDIDLMIEDHNRAAHGGVRPRFEIEHKTRFLSTMSLEYRGRAPRNVFR